MVFKTAFRYISLFRRENHSMKTAYKMRAGIRKPFEVRHMGAFAGKFVQRGFYRAGRVRIAMRCRGSRTGINAQSQ